MRRFFILFNKYLYFTFIKIGIKKRVSNEMPTTGNISNYKLIDDFKCYENNTYCLKQLNLNVNTQLLSATSDEKIIFHSYWYGLVSNKQLFSIKSFLCTQDLNKCELYLWLDKDYYEENILILQHYDLPISIKRYCPITEAKNTYFEYLEREISQKGNLAERADAFRFLILWKYGGVYFDLDVMFLKDLSSLLNNEFCYAWEKQCFANSAVLYLKKQSKLATYILQKCKIKRRFVPWIILDYNDKKLREMMIYPSAYFDPIWQESENTNVYVINTFDQFFQEFSFEFEKRIESYKQFFPGCYAYHWHNRWDMLEFENSYFGVFNKELDLILNDKIRKK